MMDMYKSRKKRVVDPNAPPRPNLFSHEKSIKETRLSVDEMRDKMTQMERHMERQEERLRSLSSQIDQIRSYLAHSRGDAK